MKNLTFEQVEEVSGGNPVAVMLIIVAARAAAPHIARAAVAAGSAIAGAIGSSHGEGAAR